MEPFPSRHHLTQWMTSRRDNQTQLWLVFTKTREMKMPTGNLLTSWNIWHMHAACTYMQGTTHKGAWHSGFELTSVDNGRVPKPLVSCQTKFRGRQMVTIPMFNCRNVLLGRFPPTKDHSRLLNSCIVLMSDIFVSPMQQDSSNRFRSRWQLTFTKHIWPSLDRRWAANTVSPHRAPKPQRPDPDLGGPLFQRFQLGNVWTKNASFP